MDFTTENEAIDLAAEPFEDRQSSVRAPYCEGGIPYAQAIDEKGCSWPLWSPDKKIGNCCGQPRHMRPGLGGMVQTPYCSFHYRRAYNPRTPSIDE